MWLTKSSVGRKLIMSISGLFLILFLTFHMSMNLVAIISDEAYNGVCAFLGSNWYAVAGTAVLAAGVFVHFAFAIMLTLQNRRARGEQRYAVTENQPKVEWASQNMFVLGAIVILGLAVHLSHFWAHMMLPELVGSEELLLSDGVKTYAATDGAGLISYTFKNPVNVVIYVLWLCALWFHLTHGMWSAMQTLGANNNTWMPRWKMISNIFATVVCFGFIAVVIYGAIA
ncbi:MAG: succinate dehydrogenase cytochrome b subunit [Paludibacteraceae bacterium]|nr:succinate dehydrogenase cytochrome b subunit [Paludibacteraceae bacterium]